MKSSNKDKTVIFLTLNNLPTNWEAYHKQVLLESIGDAELITISRIPTDMGKGINLIQTETPSANNVYKQLLRGAKLATTEFIAVAESDSLYCIDHFEFTPPRNDVFYYNLSHWSIFAWDTTMFSWRNRRGNWTLVCNRQLLIDALEERFAKYPEGTPPGATGELGRWRTDKQLGVTPRRSEDFYTYTPIINMNHEFGLDDRAKRHWKRHGTLRAHSIPYWNTPADILKHFC